MVARARLFAMVMALGGVIGSPAGAESQVFPVAVLQGLDKVTARVERFDVAVGGKVRFGALEIVVRTCRERPAEELPESAAFLEIWEIVPGEAAANLFSGWMFASSPALSALEHPVYDVWVLDCKDAQPQ